MAYNSDFDTDPSDAKKIHLGDDTFYRILSERHFIHYMD